MKKTAAVLLVIFLIALFSQTGVAQDKALVEEIARYVKKIDSPSKRSTEPDLVFADISQNGGPRWRKFSSSKSLEKFRQEKAETYCISNNWLRKGKIIVSVFTLFSESGDWANYVYYYFREDGTLAKIEAEYRTFYGNFAAATSIFFNSKGKVIKKSVKYFDLAGNPAKPSADYLRENSPMMNDFGYYKTTGKLPFYHLLKAKK